MVCPARKGKTVNIDPREIAALAAAQPAAPRVDMYAGIHKALRTCMTDTLLALGRMDTDDDLEFAQTCDRVMQLLDLCRSHLHHENDFVHTAMQARAVSSGPETVPLPSRSPGSRLQPLDAWCATIVAAFPFGTIPPQPACAAGCQRSSVSTSFMFRFPFVFCCCLFL